MNLVCSINWKPGCLYWCLLFLFTVLPGNLQSYNTSIHLSIQSPIHPQIYPHIYLLMDRLWTHPHSNTSIHPALHLYIHPLNSPSIRLSFLHALLPTRSWIGNTHVTEINKVEVLCFKRHSYLTKRETNEYNVNTGLWWNVQGVTKRDKVIDKLPGSHGDFTNEGTLRPELEESF